MKRRQFIRTVSLAGAATWLPGPLRALDGEELLKLTILHTNDVHSRIEPFPLDDRNYPGLGGAAARSAIIRKIRQAEEHVLLLDAGDILQGTPYFNFFNGELEFRLMNEMGYDAATIGNHDFDGGMEALQRQLQTASFPMLNCNYDFRDTVMANWTKPYQVFNKGKLKIGVFGVGVELDGLVPPALFGPTTYQDPIAPAQQVADHLKNDLQCDYVILLSHLGYRYDGSKVSDLTLAAATSNIDLIIGGHTHTFLKDPVLVRNKVGKEVMINQVGWAGLILGKIDVFFQPKNRKKWVFGETVIIDEKSSPI